MRQPIDAARLSRFSPWPLMSARVESMGVPADLNIASFTHALEQVNLQPGGYGCLIGGHAAIVHYIAVAHAFPDIAILPMAIEGGTGNEWLLINPAGIGRAFYSGVYA